MDNSITQTIPNGYKLTEVGVIPMNWKQINLGENTNKIGSGKTPTGGEKVYKQNGRPFVRSQNVGWGKLILDDLAFIDDQTHTTFPSTEIKDEDILLNITGASIGRCAMADKRVVGGNVNQHVCIIRTIKENLIPGFLEMFLLSKKGQSQIDSFQAGGNRQGLNFEQISSFIIPIPKDTKEQSAISVAISDIESLIDKTDKLIDKKKAIKQGAMQQLLSGKKRLPGFSGEWKEKKLGDISKIESGINKSLNFIGKGGTKYITVMELYEGSKILTEKAGRIEVTNDEIRKYSLKSGDIVFGKSSVKREGIGYPNIFIEDKEPAVFSGFTFRSRVFRELADPFFIIHILRANSIRDWLINNSQASALTNINQTIANNIPIFIPSDIKEQTAIATILSYMDKEIESLEQKRDKHITIKQGMMQQLLTGKIRIYANN